jgi:hypothetical protein
VAADGVLKCAGAVHTMNFGTTFASVPDRLGVDQILMSPTVNTETGNGMCVHQDDGTVWCMGNFNDWGQFGAGFTGPSPSFVQWGDVSNVVAIGTGTWDQICALDTSSNVSCTGLSFGTTPTIQGGSSTSRFWVTTFGIPVIDDPGVFRAAEGRTECTVGTAGLVCDAGATTLGDAGEVVMGGPVSELPDLVPGTPRGFCGGALSVPACWLDTSGRVRCARCTAADQVEIRPYFSDGRVLSLGLNYYDSNLCAVYDDGSLWCLGANRSGMLGTGDMAPRTTPVRVQPPGSVRIGCPQ